MLTAELMREVRRIEIRARRRVDESLAGDYHTAFRGQGVEFSEVREYAPGDDVRAIDWNVTARAGRPFIKRYIEERQLTVVIAVDASASMRFSTCPRSKLRVAAEVGAVLAVAAARNNDRTALLIHNESGERWLPPAKGRGHLTRLVRDLLAAEPEGAGQAPEAPLRHLDRVLHRHAVVFLLGDHLDHDLPSESWSRAARALAQRHDVIAVTIEDPAEREPPAAGLVRAVDPETGHVTALDLGSSRARRRVTAALSVRRAEFASAARAAGFDHVRLSTDSPFGDVLADYIHSRSRRRGRRA